MSARTTESFITKKFLHDRATLAGAIQALSGEIDPNVFPAAASPKYRKNLALNLFYKVHFTGCGERYCTNFFYTLCKTELPGLAIIACVVNTPYSERI